MPQTISIVEKTDLKDQLFDKLFGANYLNRYPNCSVRIQTYNETVSFDNKRLRIAAALTALVWNAPTKSLAFSPERANTASILNSGSTNVAGFKILVSRSGKAEYLAGEGRRFRPDHAAGSVSRSTIPRDLLHRFYSDLEALRPLADLPHQRCMKSMSFGTTLEVEFGGEKSPDLSCGDGGDLRLQALKKDVDEIIQLFGPNQLAPVRPGPR